MEKDAGNTEFIFDNVISTYTQQEAIEDGILIPVGLLASGKPIIFTTHLFDSGGYEDLSRLLQLIEIGMSLLKKPDPQDTPTMKLRVIEEGRIWVIWNAEGITFMRPEDY